MNATIEIIIKNWPIIVTILGATAAAGLSVYLAIKIKIPEIIKRLEKLEAMELIEKSYCANIQTNCQALVCAKIEAIKHDLKNMDRQREKARDDLFEQLIEINKTLGRVDQFMRDYPRA